MTNQGYIVKTINQNECKFYKDAALAMSPLFLIAIIILTSIAVAYTRGFYKGLVEYKKNKNQ